MIGDVQDLLDDDSVVTLRATREPVRMLKWKQIVNHGYHGQSPFPPQTQKAPEVDRGARVKQERAVDLLGQNGMLSRHRIIRRITRDC